MNPYSPPDSDPSRLKPVMAYPKTRNLFSAAIIRGCACYLPILGVRGAGFCLFPGIVRHSWQLAFKGGGFGFLYDIVVEIGSSIVLGPWEPRAGYNRLLVNNLPPGFDVITHVGSPVPNSLKFCLGLIIWMSVMYAIWIALWILKLNWARRLQIPSTGAMCVGVCAIILWIVAPLDEFWQHGAQPFGDLAPVPFLAVFLTTMPLCSLIVASTLYFL